jgi:hypothetical protein
MTPLQLTRSLLESGTYDYATTDIQLPDEVADFLIQWGRLNIPEDALHQDENGGKGLERESHVTVKYGLLAREVPPELKAIAKETSPFVVVMGKVSLFTTSPDYDVVKLDVESPALRRLNQQVSHAVAHEDTHPTYNPHVTIAYVEKGTCDHLEGEDPFKSDDLPREFIASGMTYRGPGADDDPERVKETILFSRTKRPDAVLGEAVVGPPQAQMELIKDEITSAAQESGGDVSIFLALVKDALEPHGVYFGLPPEMQQYGSPAVATPEGVFIQVPRAYDLVNPHWPEQVMAMAYHELVHGHQMSKMADPDAVSDKATAWMTPHGRIDQDRYLQQKQEIMAWAASMVDSWRRQGLTSEQMMRRLRSGNWGFAQKYWVSRVRFPQAFNRFVKQATEYIEQLREAKFAEALTGLDPFAQCAFPVDPDQTKYFLRKRRGERPIL